MTHEFWQEIINNKYQISSDPSPQELLPELLEMLASSDTELRDDFAYAILATWIGRGAFSHQELTSLLSTLEQRLEIGLGEVETDSVFARSFAILMLAVLVNNPTLALEQTEVLRLLEVVLSYLEREQDLRGFVQPQGWAHAVAHTADLLDEFAVNPNIQTSELEKILNAIVSKIPAQTVWLFDEEDRLSYAAARVLGRGLISNEVVSGILDALAVQISQADEHKSNAIPRHNAKAFLRSLYFQILKLEPNSAYLELILNVLGKF